MIWILLFFLNTIFFFLLPIEIYYYSPGYIPLLGGILSIILTHYVLKVFINETFIPKKDYVFIKVFVGVGLWQVFLSNYKDKLHASVFSDGRDLEAIVLDREIASGRSTSTFHMIYEYKVDGNYLKSSCVVPFEYYMNYFEGDSIPIVYLRESPHISLINLSQMTPNTNARADFFRGRQE